MAWAKFNGPLGALADDYRHADLVMRTSITGKPGEERDIRNYLPPWRRPSDYRPWGIDIGDDPKPEEFTTED